MDYSRIAQLQEKLTAAGWRWTETTFADGDAYIRFTMDQDNGMIMCGYNSAPYGWGRFPRLDAWEQAYKFLALELGPRDSIDRLREYKSQFSA